MEKLQSEEEELVALVYSETLSKRNLIWIETQKANKQNKTLNHC